MLVSPGGSTLFGDPEKSKESNQNERMSQWLVTQASLQTPIE